jgi:hypothetical protein
LLFLLPAWAATTAVTIAVSAAIASASATTTRTSAAKRAATTAAARISAFSAWASFVHSQRAAAEVSSVQCGDRGIGLGAIGHFDETKAAQSAAELVTN